MAAPLSEPQPLASSALASRQGRTHQHNQDRAAIWDNRVSKVARQRRGLLYVLCDGVSGVRDGAWAAEWTCERMSAFFETDISPNIDGIMSLVHEIDWELRGRGQGLAACTLAALWLHERRATVVQVGDSDVLFVRDDQPRRIEGRKGGGRRLEAWMGMGPSIDEAAHVWTQDLLIGDLFFLLTDGVTSLLEPKTILDCWWSSRGSPIAAAESIVSLAESKRAPDDATVIVVDILDFPPG